MNAVSVLSEKISRMKGRQVVVDENLHTSYVARLIITRSLMLARGIIRFPLRKNRPYLGPGATLIQSRKIEFGASVTLARNSYVDAMSRNGVRLGDGSTLGVNSRIECTGSIQHVGHGIEVGKRVGMGTDSLFGCAGGISIGDDTIIGNYVSFHSENHKIDNRKKAIQDQGVTHEGISVGRDCWIGSKSTVLDGANIGNGCVIAAGSVVTAGNYEDFGIFGGVPARRIGTRGPEDAEA